MWAASFYAVLAFDDQFAVGGKVLFLCLGRVNYFYFYFFLLTLLLLDVAWPVLGGGAVAESERGRDAATTVSGHAALR